MAESAVWGDFEVDFLKVLGRGGMGTVYRARQRSLDRWVAVKVLDPSRVPDPTLLPGFLQKFQVEIRALSCLQDPRIVTIYQAGENDGRVWFAMELIEGRTIERCLFEDGAFAPAEGARIAGEVARALEAAWRRGIVHRDVKPANIFLGAGGTVKLADFGLARSEAFSPTRLTDVHAVACTPAYAAPETAHGRSTDPRSDLYSLGCVLYEMVTERPPFTDDTPAATLRRHSSETPLSPRLLNPEVPVTLEAVILRCLRKDPAERYPTYTEFLRDLEPPAAESKAVWPWAAAAGAALIGVILTAVLSNVPPSPVAPPLAILRPAVQPAPPPQLKELDADPVPLAEAAPARYIPSEEEIGTVKRALAVSRERASGADGALEDLSRSATPWARDFVRAEREALQTSRTIADLSGFDSVEAPGVVDRAIERALRAADRGEFSLMAGLEIPDALETAVRPFVSDRLTLFRRERAAAEHREADRLFELLDGFSGTIAARMVERELLAEFRSGTEGPELELVDEVTFGSWAPDTAGPRPRYEHASGCYVLSSRDGPVWIKREFQGARKGYRIRFRFGVPGEPLFLVALSSSRWCAVSPHDVVVYRKDGAEATPAARFELPSRLDGGSVSVVPKSDVVAVYLDDGLLFALPAREYGLDRGMKVGGGLGTVILESIRVRDRTR